MTPPSHRREKKQLSMRIFTEPKDKGSSNPPPVPRPFRNSTLRPMPPPTAPPFFKQKLSRPKLPSSQGSTADDAWAIGESVFYGKKIAPARQYGDDGAPVPESLSDDDFEPDTAQKRIARERPAATRRHSASGLRDDRASMTKRSATKRKRPRKLVRVASQLVPLAFDTERDPAMQTPAPAAPVQPSSEQSGDCDRFLVEGDKIEMSSTDDDEDRSLSRSPPPAQYKKPPRPSIASRAENPAVGKEHGDTKAQSGGETSGECLRQIKALKDNERKVANLNASSDQPTNHARRRHMNKTAEPASTELDDGTNKTRRRPPPKFCVSDSDDDVMNSFTCRAKAKKSPCANDCDSSSGDSDSDVASPIVDERDELYKTPPGTRRRIGTRSSTRKAARSVSKKLTSPVIVVSESDDEECLPERGVPSEERESNDLTTRPSSLKRLKRRVYLSDSSDDKVEEGLSPVADSFVPLSKSKVKKISVTPDATPSPPSTKKRRLRQKLVSVHSDDDCAPIMTGFAKYESPGKDTVTIAPEPRKTPRSDVAKSAEWYQERDIDHFSSSSADFKAPSSSGSTPRGLAEKTKRRNGCRSPTAPPVRREILKSFSDDLDDDLEGNAGVSEGNTPTQSPSKTAGATSDFHATKQVQEPGDEASLEVLDLVDIIDDDEKIKCVQQRDSSSVENDVIRNSSSPLDVENFEVPLKVPRDCLDDKPPPFNLLVLCNPGESVREMRDRLGEEVVIARVSEAQQEGRDIIGGDELGLTKSFNRNIFDRFSKVIVGDQLGRERKARVVTEQALRGEYKFHYRGRDQPRFENRRRQKTTTGKASRGRGRLSNLRRRRYQS